MISSQCAGYFSATCMLHTSCGFYEVRWGPRSSLALKKYVWPEKATITPCRQTHDTWKKMQKNAISHMPASRSNRKLISFPLYPLSFSPLSLPPSLHAWCSDAFCNRLFLSLSSSISISLSLPLSTLTLSQSLSPLPPYISPPSFSLSP